MNYTPQQFKSGQVLRAAQLNNMDTAIKTAMASALPVKVELRKQNKSETKQGVPVDAAVNIRISNLNPDATYVIQLYTKSRDGQRWVTMYDEEDASELYGYRRRLAGKVYTGEKGLPFEHFDTTIPSWMPNNGVLTSRWLIPANVRSYTLELKPQEWLLDNLKPMHAAYWSECNNTYNFIGVKNSRHRSLQFKVGVLEQRPTVVDQLVGLSDTTILIANPGTEGLKLDSLNRYIKPISIRLW
jgi:hypothetical protein